MSSVARTASSPPAAELAALDAPIEQQRFRRWREGGRSAVYLVTFLIHWSVISTSAAITALLETSAPGPMPVSAGARER